MRRFAKTTVYIVDHISFFREGIYAALADDQNIDVIGDSGSINDAHRFLQIHYPSIVILSATGRRWNGLRLANWLRQKRPAIGVILIVDNEDDRHLLAAVKSGASATFTRFISTERLVQLVREVASGHKLIDQSLLRQSITTKI